MSAWAAANGLVLGQVKTDEHSNEITAIPALLDLLKAKGCIVTIDAAGCQQDIAKKIREKKADYVFALKGNQPNLHEDVQYFFKELEQKDLEEEWIDSHNTVDKGHGRIEIREYYQSNEIAWLPELRRLWVPENLSGVFRVFCLVDEVPLSLSRRQERDVVSAWKGHRER